MNPLTDSGARMLALTQLLASAEQRLVERQAREGRQPNDTLAVDNFTRMLTDSLDMPGRIAQLDQENTQLRADLYERDTIIAGQRQELTQRIPEADFIELQHRHTRVVAEVDKLKKKLEQYEEKKK